MSLPQTIVELAPIEAPSPTCVFEYWPLLFTADRGLITLVNTIDGPRNTSESQVTPEYIETLF